MNANSLLHFGKVTAIAACLCIGLLGSASAQQVFKSPEDAAQALVAALRAQDKKAIAAILGPNTDDLISSGDNVEDDIQRKAFLASFDQKHGIKSDGNKPATLMFGADDYPFAIPIAKKGDGWAFDAAAGRDEMLARRIGKNELATIQSLLAYVDAQYEYSAVTKVGNLPVYAQRILSSPGTRNGLYWPATANESPSPLGEAVAAATRRGNRVGRGDPYHGYYFKILTRQGAKAPGGAYDYIVNGKMIGGFALVAWPAQYGNTGIMTFMINHDGVVFEKDLGENTARLAPAISSFNPDGWEKAKIDP